jgi:hypothetical protein
VMAEIHHAHRLAVEDENHAAADLSGGHRHRRSGKRLAVGGGRRQ